MEIGRLGADDVEVVLAASPLFDGPATREWATRFLTREAHHMYVALVDDAIVGFVTGLEMTHPDKGTEMLLYELAVDEAHRRRGYGRALAQALAELAVERGCYGMWVGTEPENAAAIATYRSAGALPPESVVNLTWTFARG